MNVDEVKKEVAEEFMMFPESERYYYLMEHSQYLPLIAPEDKNDAFLVKGCQSRLWLKGEMKDGNVHYTGDSDAYISKGMAGLLLRIYNDRRPDEILNASLSFLEDAGIKGKVMMNRAIGMASILDQMKRYAVAFSSQGSSTS